MPNAARPLPPVDRPADFHGRAWSGRRAGLSRRTVLRSTVLGTFVAAAAAGVTAGCGAQAAVPDVAADPLETLIKEKQALLDEYVATISAHPGLRARLSPLRDAHRQHRDALLELIDARRRAALGRATPPVPGPATAASAPPVSGDRSTALVTLRAAERTAMANTRAACLQVTDPPAEGDVSSTADRLAILGSITAAEASHEVALA